MEPLLDRVYVLYEGRAACNLVRCAASHRGRVAPRSSPLCAKFACAVERAALASAYRY
ncbi:MAG: hypothetical protein RMH97_07170 [Verrucomicrobiales bacterium]|nr:hypothetical protein [Verrucomicrobiales bacterium]